MPTTQETQDWIAAYLEIVTLIKLNLPGVKHIDLWWEQPFYEKEEYSYATPAVFIEFNSNNIDTLPEGVQDINGEFGIYYEYETVSDTHDGSLNQETALNFITGIRDLHALLQTKYGDNFSSLDRKSIKRIPTPNLACIVYRQGYNTIVRDYGAKAVYGEKEITDLGIGDEAPPVPDTDPNLYTIDMEE